MAHFAKMTEDGINVLGVHVVSDEMSTDDEGNETEAQGIRMLNKIHNWPHWRKCSYNTHGGVHALGGTPYRKNYPGKGSIYDASRDAFISPQPYPSWTLNETTCCWESPIPYREVTPGDSPPWWDESSQSWRSDDPEA